jgi:biofilm protein TabA
MIYDKLALFSRYAGLGKKLSTALSYLATQDFTATRPGRIDIQGDDLYALVQEYTTRPVGQGVWEAHRCYIDVQNMVSGQERIFFAPVETMQLGTYVEEKDFLSMTGDGSPLDLFAGFFVVFFPEDAHMPGLQVGTPEFVRKIVIKLAV